METTVNKQELINWINELEDQATLKNLQLLKNNTESRHDFWDDLPEKTRKAINRAKKELDEGKGIPHNKMMAEIRNRFP